MRMHEILNEIKERAWSKKEIKDLIRMYEVEKKKISEIARALDRSPSSINEKLNQLFPNREKKDQKPWADEEIETLKNMYKQGASQADIARALDRKPASITQKLNQLFPNREKKDQKPWADEEIETLKNMYKQGVGPTKIARALDRSRGLIIKKLDVLFTNRKKKDLRPFTDEEIKKIKDMFKSGYGYTKIGIELGRHPGTVSRFIKRDKEEYQTVLLPAHLENLKILVGTSYEEIDFFNELEKVLKTRFHNRDIKIERNIRLPRGGRFFYNIDGIFDGNQVVEYFGQYHHADPVTYPDPNKYLSKVGATAGEVRDYDEKKIAWLREKYGKDPVVIWGREWRGKSTKQECIDRVLSALGLI